MKKTNYCKIITGCLKGEQVKVGGQFWYAHLKDAPDKNFPIARFIGWNRNEGPFPLPDRKGGEIDLSDVAYQLLYKGIIINPQVSKEILNYHSIIGIMTLMKKNMTVHTEDACSEECPYLHEHHLLSECYHHQNEEG